MADNKALTSNNKIVQSLDLYTNNILNVSKIVGNQDYPNRSKDLEISTRDKTDTKAGNLLLRAGIANSDSNKGYVHIFAGNTNENATTNADGIYVNPDGRIYTTATAQAITQSGTNNKIELTATDNKLEISNDTASANSTKTLVLQAQSVFNPSSVTNGITIDRISGDKIDIKTSALTATGDSTVTIQAKTEVANSIKLEKTGNKLTVKNSTASYESASQLTAKTSSNNTVILTENDKQLAVSNAKTTIASSTSITETAPTITLQAKTEENNFIKLEESGAKLTVKNTTEEHTSASQYKVTVPRTSGGSKNTVLTLDADSGANNNLQVDARKVQVNVTDIVTAADTHNKIYVGSTDSSNYIELTKADNKLTVKNLAEEHTTDAFTLTATESMSIKGQSKSGNETPFEVSIDRNNIAGQSKATLTVSDLHINNDIKFGGLTDNNLVGRGATATNVPITGKAGAVDIEQVGTFSFTGQNSSSSLTGQFSLKNTSTQEDTSKTKSLLTIQHENVTERAYVNNLDVYGDIRLGTLSNVSTGHPATASEVSAANTSLTAKLAKIDLATTTDFAIDATKIQITGNSTASTGNTDALQISSQGDGISGSGTYATADKSYIKADVVHAKRDFYGNNVHMYWDADTSSLVFAKII